VGISPEFRLENRPKTWIPLGREDFKRCFFWGDENSETGMDGMRKPYRKTIGTPIRKWRFTLW